jgi:hypothetical protein
VAGRAASIRTLSRSNGLAIAPVILPAIGYAGERLGSKLVFYDLAGVMRNVGIYFR